LYQQNVVSNSPPTTFGDVEVPATQTSSLLTYYDFNDPTIMIEPPI
jgi:hypothetical protein